MSHIGSERYELDPVWWFSVIFHAKLFRRANLMLLNPHSLPILHQQALAIYESISGPNHRDTANYLNNLSQLYSHKGLYAEAEPLCKRALAIRELVLGQDHSDTAACLNNLADLYDSQGKYERAEPLY